MGHKVRYQQSAADLIVISRAYRGMETYVFGTGASAPYGAPTMGEFLAGHFLDGCSYLRIEPTFEEDLKIVARAIDDQYGTNVLAAQQGGDHFSYAAQVALNKINVEELLALADERRTPDIRKALERVIFKTIERNIHSSSSCEYYNLLMSENPKSGQETCLITFNYDLLLDRALQQMLLATQPAGPTQYHFKQALKIIHPIVIPLIRPFLC